MSSLGIDDRNTIYINYEIVLFRRSWEALERGSKDPRLLSLQNSGRRCGNCLGAFGVGRNPCGRFKGITAPHWITVIIVCVSKEKAGVVLGLRDSALDQLSP